MDFRGSYSNCHDCAEFQDHKQTTMMCSQCECYECEYDRDKCLIGKWCKRDKIEIEIE